jgi:hypothetical protein
MASKQQLKAIRKKYHLGEFRKVNKARSRVKSMAKRRSRRSYSKGRTRHYSRGSHKADIGGVLIGTGAYLAFKAFVEPMITQAVPQISGPVLPIVEGFAGYMLMSNRNKTVADIGKATLTLSAFSVLSTYVLPMVAGTSAGAGGIVYY